MGWALKATKKRPGLGEKVKAYLVEKFEVGERSGTKADPPSVSREMKFLNKGDNGKLIFTPEEWKAQQSIKSFLSRYSAKLRKQEINKSRDMHSTEQEIEDRRRRYRSFGVRNGHAYSLRLSVYNELKNPGHPIEVNNFDIYKLARKAEIKALKLHEIKAICATIGLTIEESQARKFSFAKPLENLVKRCCCNNPNFE